MRIPITLVFLLASTAAQAHAQTSRPRAGAPRGGRLAHPVVETIDEHHSTLTFVLTTNAREGREVVVPIVLPEGMIATELSISMGGEAAEAAYPYQAGSARELYDGIVAQIKDPALLEWSKDGQLRLSVFPVMRGVPARVTIVLTADDESATAELARVDREMSLIATPGIKPRRERYVDYWPPHHSIVPVAMLDADD